MGSDFRPVVLLLAGLVIFWGAGQGPEKASRMVDYEQIWLTGAGIEAGLYLMPKNISFDALYTAAGLTLPARDTGRISLVGPRALRIADGATPQIEPLPPEACPSFFQPVSINVADQEILEAIPGIGPKLASEIIAFRNQQGRRVTNFNELERVRGIGPAKLARLKEYLTAP